MPTQIVLFWGIPTTVQLPITSPNRSRLLSRPLLPFSRRASIFCVNERKCAFRQVAPDLSRSGLADISTVQHEYHKGRIGDPEPGPYLKKWPRRIRKNLSLTYLTPFRLLPSRLSHTIQQSGTITQLWKLQINSTRSIGVACLDWQFQEAPYCQPLLGD